MAMITKSDETHHDALYDFAATRWVAQKLGDVAPETIFNMVLWETVFFLCVRNCSLISVFRLQCMAGEDAAIWRAETGRVEIAWGCDYSLLFR